jgi:hypothetical protein
MKKSPCRAGGRQARELLGWVASSRPNYDTLHFLRRACRLARAARNLRICGVPQPFEHFDFSAHSIMATGTNMQSAAWGTPHFSPKPVPSGGQGKRGSCWAESHPPSRTTTPFQHISREEHFAWPGPHGTSACVNSRNLSIISNSPLNIATVGTICKVRRGAHHIFLKGPCRAGGGREEAAGLDRILQAELRHLAKTFPAKSISLSQGQTELLHL